MARAKASVYYAEDEYILECVWVNQLPISRSKATGFLSSKGSDLNFYLLHMRNVNVKHTVPTKTRMTRKIILAHREVCTSGKSIF